MANFRKVFPSYDWDDVMYVNQIINLPIVMGVNNVGFMKNVPNEEVKSCDAAIRRWIDNNMVGCSCLVLFVGERTYQSRWVKYELEQAISKGMGLLKIDITGMTTGYRTSRQGIDPIAYHHLETFPNGYLFGHYSVKSYRWTAFDRPQDLIGSWIEDACTRAYK